jgi:hypothetical protein
VPNLQKKIMKMVPLASLVVLALVVAAINADHVRLPSQYPCILCEQFVQKAILERTADPKEVCRSPLDACATLLPIMKELEAQVLQLSSPGSTVAKKNVPFHACLAMQQCVEDRPVHIPATNTLPNVHVAPGYGTRPYGTVRLTVVDDAGANRSQAFQDYFQYHAPFQYRWTDRTLYTTLVEVVPGVKTNINVGGAFNITVNYPKRSDYTRGVLVADPCFSSRYMICLFGSILQIDVRLSTLLSALGDNNQMDYFGVLGDNFYDRDGTLAPPFFNSLSDATKSKFLITAPGNHDFWIMGTPWLAQPKIDSTGNGFFQYYGQDTLASVQSFPYNFSVNPDKEDIFDHYDLLPDFSNFFFYNTIGSVGYIGYSGAHFLSDLMPHLQEACTYFAAQNTSWVFLVGHWNTEGDGSALNMTTNYLYRATLLQLDGCKQLGSHRIKYMLGHTHCNVIDEVNRGFMIGGFGMGGSLSDCADFGLPYIESTARTLEVTYFPITHRFDMWDDQYDAVLNCIQTVGLANCKELGRTWLKQSL